MSKNVLVLSSSPRKGGNSDLLCDQFMLGAKEAGNQTGKIFLKDKRISYCTGCGSCYTSHKCVQQDDMAEVMEKMILADVVVMATPVYFYILSERCKRKEYYLWNRCLGNGRYYWKRSNDSGI
jgi:multimeric flavodoxin WrbA